MPTEAGTTTEKKKKEKTASASRNESSSVSRTTRQYLAPAPYIRVPENDCLGIGLHVSPPRLVYKGLAVRKEKLIFSEKFVVNIVDENTKTLTHYLLSSPHLSLCLLGMRGNTSFLYRAARGALVRYVSHTRPFSAVLSPSASKTSRKTRSASSSTPFARVQVKVGRV